MSKQRKQEINDEAAYKLAAQLASQHTLDEVDEQLTRPTILHVAKPVISRLVAKVGANAPKKNERNLAFEICIKTGKDRKATVNPAFPVLCATSSQRKYNRDDAREDYIKVCEQTGIDLFCGNEYAPIDFIEIVEVNKFAARVYDADHMPTPVKFPVCPKCHFELINDESFGYIPARDQQTGETYSINERGWKTKDIACPVCSPKAKANRDRRRQRETVSRLFGHSNIPERMREWTFATYPKTGDQAACEYMQDFALGDVAPSIYLWGEKGHTKSGLAVAVAQEFMAAGESVLFVHALTFYRQLRQEVFHFDENKGKIPYATKIGGQYINILELASSVKLFILDEVGVGNPTQFVCSTLLELIERRRNAHGLYTIMTSNKNVKSLAESFGTVNGSIDEDSPGFRVAERIFEDYRRYHVRGEKQRIFDMMDEE